MDRKQLISQGINERVLRSFLSNLGIDPEAQIISDEIAEQILSQVKAAKSNQSANQKPQLNQGSPSNLLDELKELNQANESLLEQLYDSAAKAEIERMAEQGAYIGAMAMSAYQQAMLDQITSMLKRGAETAEKRLKKMKKASFVQIYGQAPRERTIRLISENFQTQSTRFLPIYGEDTHEA